MGLSARNGWLDDNGRVFLYFTQEEVMTMLDCGKGRNKERFKNFLTAQNAPPLSCADVQEEATAGSAKPRRKACSTGRASGRSGAWGNPNKRAGISEKDILAHCLPTLLFSSYHTSDSWFLKST